MEPIYPGTLRSTWLAAVSEEEDCAVHESILPDSVVVVATSDKSLDTIWFIKVVDVSRKEPTKPVIDDYGHIIPAGTAFMEGHFLKKTETLKSSTVYKVSRRDIF